MAHGLETVLDCADLLRKSGRNDIGFLLVGDGARRQSLVDECETRGLRDWVQFTGLLSKLDMPKVLASSNVLLVHLRSCELFQTVIPSKIFEAMAMEKPIIMGVQGESADIVQKAQAGIDMVPGNAQSLYDCVTKLKDDSKLYARLSRNGRSFVMKKFSRDSLASTFLDLINSVVKNAG